MMSSRRILSATLLLALLLSKRGAQCGGGTATPEQLRVGDRGFGSTVVFVLLAGEIHTTFTLLFGSD